MPRGEHKRLVRYYPALQTIYQHIVVAVPGDADPVVVDAVRALPGLVLVNRDWVSGRHTVVEAGLETGADFIHYVDGDRLIRWVETRPDELRMVVERMQSTDCLVIERTAGAFATHPMAQQQTERLSNQVCSWLLGWSLDFSAGSKGFSREAAEFLLRNSPPGNVMGTDSEWVILLDRGGFYIEETEVDGLDWETADRFLAQAADAETQKRIADEYDANPQSWSFRVRVAQDIIDAGYAALSRPLEERT
jgi:hypothetical protein